VIKRKSITSRNDQVPAVESKADRGGRYFRPFLDELGSVRLPKPDELRMPAAGCHPLTVRAQGDIAATRVRQDLPSNRLSRQVQKQCLTRYIADHTNCATVPALRGAQRVGNGQRDAVRRTQTNF